MVDYANKFITLITTVMKFRTIFLSLLAAAAVLTGCQRERENLGIPSIAFGQQSLTFDKDGGVANINVTVSRDWTATTEDDWIGITKTSGQGSVKPQTIEISVLPNDGYNRTGTVNFVVGKKLISRAYVIYQDGPEGEAPISGKYYDYSLKTAGQGSWTIEDRTLPEGIDAVWTYDSKYGMKATAYAGGTNYASESWLVSPAIELADTETNYVSFTHAGQYFGNIKDEATFWISDSATKADGEEEWTQLTIPTYPTNWTFVNSGDIDISAYKGKTVRFAFIYKSTASKAGTWEVDALTVSTEKQGSGDGSTDPVGPTPVEGAIYADNFDKETATQTYGSGSSWPYGDQFENWKNPTGSGAANVTYEFTGISIRANSASNGNYSIYSGSGANNIFFGANAHFQVQNIALGDATNLSLTFGSEKYTQADSKFNKDEFKVYVSNTGEGATWVSIDYDFAQGGLPEGKWDLATANFTVPSGTSKLYIYIAASVASAYRLDDLTLAAAEKAGTAVDFSKGVDLGTQGGGSDQSEDPDTSQDPAPAGTVYANNFDKTTAAQDANKHWPFADQFDGWKNQNGSGAANVDYAVAGITVRANSASNGTYSDYAGSGANNLFFGANNYVNVKNIATDGATAFALSFGTEKYTQADALFNKDEFKVYVSNTGTGASWVSLDYDFAKGTMPNGRWDLATAHFTVPQGTQTLYLYFTASVASAYRLDDLTLVSETASATSQSVDFGRGVDLGTQGGTPDQSEDPGFSDDPVPVDGELIFEESFATGEGSFTIDNGELPTGLSYVWSYRQQDQCMKASAYYQKAYATEAWLYKADPIDLSNVQSAFLTFEHTGQYFPAGQEKSEVVFVCVSVDGEEWFELDIPNWFTGSDWNFVSSGAVDLSDFAGEQIYLAFVYTSTDAAAATWEIRNLKVYSGEGGNTNPDNSQDPAPDDSQDPDNSQDPDVSTDPVNGMAITVTELAKLNQWKDNDPVSEFEYQGYTFVIDGSASQTKPIYKVNGSTQEEDIRMYANGKITVTAPAGQTMNGIAFTLSGKGLEQTATITASAGSVVAQKKGDTVITWTGQAQEVTFTVGASNDFGSNDKKTSGQFCFKQINIQ